MTATHTRLSSRQNLKRGADNMESDKVDLTQKEINYLAGVLYDKKDDLLKRKKETRMVDSLIDKALGRITLTKKGEKIVKLFDGSGYSDITKANYIKVNKNFENK